MSDRAVKQILVSAQAGVVVLKTNGGIGSAFLLKLNERDAGGSVMIHTLVATPGTLRELCSLLLEVLLEQGYQLPEFPTGRRRIPH